MPKSPVEFKNLTSTLLSVTLGFRSAEAGNPRQLVGSHCGERARETAEKQPVETTNLCHLQRDGKIGVHPWVVS